MENFTSRAMFIEKYEQSKIKIDGTNSINSNGLLAKDNKENYINSILYQSDNYIESCTKLDGVNNIMLYTDTQLSFIDGIFDSNDYSNVTNRIRLKANEVIKYKINYTKVQVDFNGYVATTGINTPDLVQFFRVELNGKVTTDYSISQDLSTIDFTGNKLVGNFNNYCTIIYYKPAEQLYTGVDIEFTYQAPNKYDVTYDELFNGVDLDLTADVAELTYVYDGNTYIERNKVVLKGGGVPVADVEEYVKVEDYVVIDGQRKRVIAIIDSSTFATETDFITTYTSVGITVYKAYWLPLLNGDVSDAINYTFNTFTGNGSRRDIKTRTNSNSTVSFDMWSNENYYNEIYDVEIYKAPVITSAIQRFIETKDTKFRIILAYHPLDADNKKVYYTNCSLVEGVGFAGNTDADSYSVSIDFERRVTLVEKGYNPSIDDVPSNNAEQVGDYVVTVD